MSKLIEIEGKKAFELGHGILNNPVSVRRDGSYCLVGLVGDSEEWENIQPYSEQVLNPDIKNQPGIWLESLGPGKLVFIPNKQDFETAKQDQQLDVLRESYPELADCPEKLVRFLATLNQEEADQISEWFRKKG